MRARRVRHPPGPELVGVYGYGGPTTPGGALGPAHPANPLAPVGPGTAAGNLIQQARDAATKAISDALGGALRASVSQFVGAGSVLLGAVLVVFGLLLASGQLGRGVKAGGKLGLFAASRGAIR